MTRLIRTLPSSPWRRTPPLHIERGLGGEVTRNWIVKLIVLILLPVLALPAAAQDVIITDDEVNAVARDMYCPVCENIPLDVCPTAACADWREEIREMLAGGFSEQEVKDAFVLRYGERVVGTPQDPTLRALSLVTPWLMGAAALVAGAYVLLRWQSRRPAAPVVEAGAAASRATDDDYRARLEADLLQRR